MVKCKAVNAVPWTFLSLGKFWVCLVTIFCFCSQKVVFTLFSNFGFKYCFLPVSIHLFLFGDCFQQRVFIYNYHLFHSLHITFTPLNPWEPWQPQHWGSLNSWKPPPQSQKQDSLINPSLLQFQKTHLKNPTGTNLERRSRHGVVECQSRSGVVTGGGILGLTISGTFLALSSLGFMLAGFSINGVRWFLVDFGLWGDWLELIFGWFWIGGD